MGPYDGKHPGAGVAGSHSSGQAGYQQDQSQSQQAAPSAPKQIAGYQNVGCEAGSAVPPPKRDKTNRKAVTRNWENCIPKFDEKELRESLRMYAAKQSCYGTSAAEKFQFTKLKHSNAYHYTLESFGESRQTNWVFVPYIGQFVDGPESGTAPGAWEIEVTRPELFQDNVYTIPVPHTAAVQVCHTCGGVGILPCVVCFGAGKITCRRCNGNKSTGGRNSRCTVCNWKGQMKCDGCDGQTNITCHSCKSNQRLLWYIQLSVIWKNHVSDHVILHTELPNELIKGVSGATVFQEEQPLVTPLVNFPDREVNNVSEAMVNEHNTAFGNERFHMQRHNLRMVPVTQAMYTWKGKPWDFFVYGVEKNVHAPRYPQTCCWGCTIL